MRTMVLLLAVAFLAACSAGGGDDTVPVAPTDPVTVVADWLQAAAAVDTGELDDLVEPQGLAVIAAVESNLRSDELVALLDSGFSEGLSSRYWEQFRDGFAVFGGSGLGDLEPGELTLLSAGFAAVALTGPDRAGHVILRETDGKWQIDFPATVGPSLVGPLGEYLTSAVGGDHAARIAAAFRDYVAPGLDAALEYDRANTRLEFEAEYIRQLTESAATNP